MTNDLTAIPQNLADVRGQIANATADCGRQPNSVTLVAVAKTKSADAVAAAYTAGQRIFGENRVQEAAEKYRALRSQLAGLRLHLIGPLQTNKVRQAVEIFDVIETIDREKLARALARALIGAAKAPACLIQVNVGRESQKAGAMPEDVDRMVRLCRDELKLPLKGLMCIPPHDVEPSPHFAFLAEVARRHSLSWLSMGMSGDFPAAIQQGATHVRVGSAIFGARPPVRS